MASLLLKRLPALRTLAVGHATVSFEREAGDSGCRWSSVLQSLTGCARLEFLTLSQVALSPRLSRAWLTVAPQLPYALHSLRLSCPLHCTHCTLSSVTCRN